MKRCPKCGSVVCDDTECRICGETLTYAETEMCDRETIPPGSYGVRYFVRRFVLPVLSLITSVAAASVNSLYKEKRIAEGYYVVMIVISLTSAAAQALIEYFYPRILGLLMKKYERGYAEALLRYAVGIYSLLITAAAIIPLILPR